MSLVNDVLRDLDSRRELPVRGLPFPGVNSSSKDTESQRPYQELLLLVISILVVALSIQVFYNKPLSQIFSSNSSLDNPLDSSSNMTVEFEQGDNDKILTDEAVSRIDDTLTLMIPLIEKELTATKQTTTQNDIVMRLPVTAHAKIEALPKNDTIQQITELPKKKIPPDYHSLKKQMVAIKKVQVAGSQYYQRAIKEYKQQRYTTSLNNINRAISENTDEKYQVLKARVLLKQKNGPEFLQFIQQRSENTSLNWFRLVAPGLQLLSYYELSNQYYLQLIKQQPENIKWPLAMALNYSKLNKSDETYRIYQSLLKSSLLSMKQKKWILSQVQSMDQSMDRKEGQRYGS
jgi:tetratricopeptide (TPR) repeat protein